MPKLREELENRKGIPCAGKSPLTDRDLMDIVKARRNSDPPGTRRNSAGRLIDAKTGRYVKDPNAKSNKSKSPKYKRNMNERKKALLRDADNPNSGLTQEARDYIKEHKGKKVPNKKYNKDYTGDVDYEVHHKDPLATRTTMEGKADIDIAENMETIPETNHKDTHKKCRTAYHKIKNAKRKQ